MTGQQLKELRTKYNLTQLELANQIGVSNTKISEWENGKYATISKAYQKLLEMYFNGLEKK